MAHFPTYVLTHKLYIWSGMASNEFKNPVHRFLYGSCDIFLTISYMIFDTIYLYVVTVNANKLHFKELMYNIVCYLIILGIVAKRGFIFGKKKRVRHLYLRLLKDFENANLLQVKEADAIIKRFDTAYKRRILFMYTSGIFILCAFFLPSILYFPTYLPFPLPFTTYISKTAVMYIIFWEIVLMCIGFFTYLSYDSLVWGFLMLLSTRLHLLQKMWETFTENYPSINFNKYITDYRGYSDPSEKEIFNKGKYHTFDEYMEHDKNIIEDTFQLVKQTVVCYQEITEEIATLENIYSFPLLIQMFGGAILIGFTIVFVTTGEFNTWQEYSTFLFCTATVSDLFIFSYYGTKVHESRSALVMAIYGSPWYEGDVPTGKLMLSTIQMMKNKLQFSAGGFIPINLPSFLSLMKLSYNLLALLK